MNLGSIELTIHGLFDNAYPIIATTFTDTTGSGLYDKVTLEFKDVEGQLMFDLYHNGTTLENQFANEWFSDVALFKLAMEVER